MKGRDSLPTSRRVNRYFREILLEKDYEELKKTLSIRAYAYVKPPPIAALVPDLKSKRCRKKKVILHCVWSKNGTEYPHPVSINLNPLPPKENVTPR